MSYAYPFCQFQLENGLQTFVVARPNGRTFTICLNFRVGTFDDPPDLLGAAHFGEHIAFQGPNRPLFAKLAESGASVNARTHGQHTEFIVWGHVDHFDSALEFIANVLRVVPAETADTHNEQRVLHHEYVGTNRGARSSAMESFQMRVLGYRHWRKSVKHYTRSLKKFTPPRVNEFLRRAYNVANARLAVVAPFEQADLRDRLERQLPRDLPPALAAVTSTTSNMQKVRPIIHVDRYSYAWINILQAIAKTDVSTRLVANMISGRLGGGPHSAMFQHLRAKRALAYDTRAEPWPYFHCTPISFFCKVPRRALRESFDFMMKMLDDAAQTGLMAVELEGEKERARRWYEMYMDAHYQMASYIAYTSHRPPAESAADPNTLLAAVENLDVSQVNETIATLLAQQNRSIFVAAPIDPVCRFFLRRRMRAAVRE